VLRYSTAVVSEGCQSVGQPHAVATAALVVIEDKLWNRLRWNIRFICGTLQTRTPGPLSQRVREHPITTRADILLTGALNRQPLERGVAGPWILRPDDVLEIQGDPTAGFAVHETRPSLSHDVIVADMKPAKHQGLAFLH